MTGLIKSSYNSLLGAAAVATVMIVASAPADATLSISNNTVSDQYQIVDQGGCSGGCIPVGQTGFIVGTNSPASAPNITVTPGPYTFTYLGSGDPIDDNVFQVTGLNPQSHNPETVTFCTQAFSGCNGGVRTPIGTSFTLILSAGDIPYTFTASINANGNGPTGCVLSNSSTTNAQPNGGCANNFLSVGNSTGTVVNDGSSPGTGGPTPLTGPALYGYIGLADGPYPRDFDFQDLAVEVQAPEPGTLAILGAGLLGLFAARKRRAAG